MRVWHLDFLQALCNLQADQKGGASIGWGVYPNVKVATLCSKCTDHVLGHALYRLCSLALRHLICRAKVGPGQSFGWMDSWDGCPLDTEVLTPA